MSCDSRKRSQQIPRTKSGKTAKSRWNICTEDLLHGPNFDSVYLFTYYIRTSEDP